MTRLARAKKTMPPTRSLTLLGREEGFVVGVIDGDDDGVAVIFVVVAVGEGGENSSCSCSWDVVVDRTDEESDGCDSRGPPFFLSSPFLLLEPQNQLVIDGMFCLFFLCV